MKNKIINLASLIRSNFKHLVTLSFFIGFIVDAILLPDYMNPISRYLGLIYILLAAALLLIKNNGALLRPRKGRMAMVCDGICRYQDKINPVLDILIAYAIGSGLSFVFIYYYRSVQIVLMWPILIVMLALMCANEFVKSASKRSIIEMALLMFTVYLYVLYVFPTLFYTLSNYVLILSIIFALIINMVFTRSILWEKEGTDEDVNKLGYRLLMINIAMPVIIGLLYITNSLPAVPITMKTVRAYNEVRREVVKNNSNYLYTTYKDNCIPEFGSIDDTRDYLNQFKELFFKKVVHIGCVNDSSNIVTNNINTSTSTNIRATSTANRVTLYTAIYMPGYFYKSNVVAHVWSHYDTTKGQWVDVKRVAYPIVGGRDGGYRGYTYIDNPAIGDWRLHVINNDNRLIGEYKFKVDRPTSQK